MLKKKFLEYSFRLKSNFATDNRIPEFGRYYVDYRPGRGLKSRNLT